MRWPFRPWRYKLLSGEPLRVIDYAWTIEVLGIVFAAGVALGMFLVWFLT